MEHLIPPHIRGRHRRDIQKLLSHAILIGLNGFSLRSTFLAGSHEGPWYDPHSLTVSMPAELPAATFKYALLHELGHFVSAIHRRFQCECHAPQELAPAEQRAQEYREEELAWAFGELLADHLSVTLEPEFHRFKKACLHSYREHHQQQAAEEKAK